MNTDFRALQPISSDVNAMTVDVEEYFQVSAFEQHVDKARWHCFPSRVEASMDRVLALFELAGIRATFFVLGCIAVRHPAMVRRLVAAGHEVASHGMSHVRVTNQTRQAFSADVRESRERLEQISGAPVQGYRAASFSISAENLWALDVLADAGFKYSSSIYPGAHPAYGMPGAPRFAFTNGENGIVEIPVTTVEMAGRRLPCAGGGFFRLYPYALTRRAFRRLNARDGQPGLFYFHPWELDPDQPRVPGVNLKTRIRHYLNLGRTEQRLARLLSDFNWDRMDRVFPVSRDKTVKVVPVENSSYAGADRYMGHG
ncbi:polysaccharide deactylase family protein [Salinisphaera dokdonensis CL-ES53]|uniref:Polysaccharide deactylase family protein n=2 Tax=Salinisphaera TaxID=180541 RepID=A0ABV2B481_9GAMM